MTKYFALVKWLGGEDDKKYTCGVPVEWIKNFDLDSFETDAFDPSLSYVIEWHKGKKEPLGGWPCYDGFIIAVSSNVSALKKMLNVLDGILSPQKVIPSNTEHLLPKKTVSEISEKEDTVRSQSTVHGEKSTATTNPGISHNSREMFQEQRASNQIDSPENSRNKETSSRISSNISDENTETNDRAMQDKHTPIRCNKGKVNSLKSNQHKEKDKTDDSDCNSDTNSDSYSLNNVSGISVLKNTQTTEKDCSKIQDILTGIHNELKKQRKDRQKRKKSHRSSSGNSSSDEDSSNRKIEVGRKGSGIFISDCQWRSAQAQATYTAMGVTLLTAMFPKDVLLVSNLRGGKRKIPRSEDSTDYQQLDQKTLEALYYTVEKAYPRTFKASTFGSAINNKINRLRRKYKKNDTAAQ